MAQSCAAVLTRRRTVGLIEGLEQFLLLLGIDPDPRVADGETQFYGCVLFCIDDLYIYVDTALLGELYRVADEVDEDLAQAYSIAEYIIGDIAGDLVI
jgi:hypothetical protein